MAGACCLAWAGLGHAQVVDYGSLQELFGEPVTTSVTGKPQRVSQVPANIEIITADQIRRSGADNLPDILRMVPGIDVRRYGFAAAEVGIRGYNKPYNPRLLVLVNGQQVYLDDYGRTQWVALPVELDEIRQIEVVKGPNSALFGFNAASGVVNIVTWDPLRDTVNAVTARGGTQEYGALSAVGTAQFGDRVGVRVSAGGFRARDFAEGPRTLTLAEQLTPRRGSVAADARVRVAPGVEAALSGSFVDFRTLEPVGAPAYAASRYRTSAVRGKLTADTGIGVLELNAYRNRLDYGYDRGIGQGGIINAVTVAQASYLVKPAAGHVVRLGLEFRDNALSIPSERSRVGYQLYAGSLMWDWQVLPRVSLTNAVRVDHLALNHAGPLLLPAPGRTQADYDSRRITDFSFNSGLVWRATDEDTLRLTLARGLQAPSLVALGFQFIVPPASQFAPRINLLGSANLNPSAVSHAELGYDREVRGLASTVRAAVFAQRTDDVISDPFSGNGAFTRQGITVRSANVGHSSAVGGELGLRGEANGFSWNASYAYINVSDHFDRARSLPWLDFQQGTPTHVVMLGGGYSWGRFEADASGRWQSTYRDYRADTRTNAIAPLDVPDYLQLSARLGYKLTEGLTFALTADQFNVSRLVQTAGRPVERRLFLSATARF